MFICGFTGVRCIVENNILYGFITGSTVITKKLYEHYYSIMRNKKSEMGLLYHEMPSELIILPTTHFPTNKNGKLNTTYLLDRFKSKGLFHSTKTLQRLVTELWRDRELDFEKNLLENGLDSIAAMRLQSRAETVVERNLPGLLEDSLTMNLGDLCIKYSDLTVGRGVVQLDDKLTKKLNLFEEPSPTVKRQRLMDLPSLLDPSDSTEEENFKITRAYDDVSIHVSDVRGGQKEIKKVYEFDMYGCVDSPAVILEHGQKQTGFLGAHSGVFICFDAKSGENYWRVTLDDAIHGEPLIFMGSLKDVPRYKELFKN